MLVAQRLDEIFMIVLVVAALSARPSSADGGKSFRRTGAWALTRGYIESKAKAPGCNATSADSVLDCSYKLDTRLAACLAAFFRGRSVTELGAGVGRYKRFIEGTGLAGTYTAYDGLADVARWDEKQPFT